jgi:hypothetical protein
MYDPHTRTRDLYHQHSPSPMPIRHQVDPPSPVQALGILQISHSSLRTSVRGMCQPSFDPLRVAQLTRHVPEPRVAFTHRRVHSLTHWTSARALGCLRVRTIVCSSDVPVHFLRF